MNQKGLFAILLALMTNGSTTIPETQPKPTVSEVQAQGFDLTVLSKYNIVSADDLGRAGTITNLEALETINRLITDNLSNWDERIWYSNPALEPLDKLPEEQKALLMSLTYSGKNPVLKTEDIVKLDFDAPLTQYNALVYLTRLTGDTYGCTDYPEELDFTEKSQTYETAFAKGLIDSKDMSAADKPIERLSFYSLLARAIYTEYNIGSYSPTVGSLAESLESRSNTETDNTNIEKTEREIQAKVTLNEDMSIEWIPAEEIPVDTFCGISTYSKDGELLSGRYGIYSGPEDNKISSRELLHFLTEEYPKVPDYIEIAYETHSEDYTSGDTAKFKIDLSNIKLVTEGQPLKPGTLTVFQNQWVPQSITLAEGQFKKGAYYLLPSYEHKYRKEDLNQKSLASFTVEQDTNKFLNETGDYYFNTFGIFTEDVHIIQAEITGNPQKGFTVHLTPESKESFKKAVGDISPDQQLLYQ